MHQTGTNAYDQYGLPQELKTERLGSNAAELMKLNYSFDAQRGNLNSRGNTAFGWNESFSYDNLDRLTNFNDNNGNQSQTYDGQGRIANNSNLGNYAYSGNSYRQAGLNNVTSAAYAWYQKRPLQQITYNAFKSPVEIAEQGKEKISFQYNGAEGRSAMYYGDTTTDKTQRRYRKFYSEDGSMEVTNDIQTGTTSFVFYLGGDAYTAPAIWKEDHTSSATAQNLYYLHRDHLGSILLITDVNGNIAEKRQFDAWGNIVKLEDGNGSALTAFVILDRGYTGHEHLFGVALIHMNGRLYDPMLHRFLSPDNFVQDPLNSQSFNRYGYVMNNPLIRVDKDGNFFFVPILIGAAIGILTNGISNATHDQPFFQGAFKSGLIGGAAGAFSFGIGQAVMGMSGFSQVAVQTLAHGYLGGVMSGMNGGNFGSGFLSGGLGSLAAVGISGALSGYSLDVQAGGTILGGGLIGGVGAELSGGDFWDGARNGLISSALNHVAHTIQSNREVDLQVRAVRTFLDDLGYNHDMVDKDVVAQTSPVFRMKYARLLNYMHYKNSFTGGGLGGIDSKSFSSDGYTSIKALAAGDREYNLKYYPSRSHSIGLIRAGFGHAYEFMGEFIDGTLRDQFGRPDNSFYKMHEQNAENFLKFRKK